MHLVIETEPGTVELNWIWLPTWLGHNTRFKESVEQHMAKWIGERTDDEGQLLITDELLGEMSTEVINHIVELFPGLTGLRKYLEALHYVGDGS